MKRWQVFMKAESRRSSLELILLGLLFEEPMHAYRMQKLIRQRGMDNIVNVRHRTSIYQTLERLRSLGLIEIQEMVGSEGQKRRLVYAITDHGREIAVAWLPKILTTVGAGFPAFPAAVSLLTLLAPDDAKRQFELRADAVGKELCRLDAEKLEASDFPQAFLVEYRRALLAAEHIWIQTVITDLSNGLSAWDGRRHKSVAIYSAQDLAQDLDRGA
jgi:DNA-binding PadR family transcriptional regulator